MFAAIFPGQGSQRPGMGKGLYTTEPAARDVFERVSEAIGRDVAAICFDLDEDQLRHTQNAQIALYTCGVAAWAALAPLVQPERPLLMAGHSVGEYAALVASGYLTVEDGARLVGLRGELMAKAGSSRPGTMAAVMGLERADLEAVCRDASRSGVVVIANDNCPGQLVVSGDFDAVAAASALASERGARRVLPLNVSGAFHSPLMTETVRELGEALRSTAFVPGQVAVVSNVTARSEPDPAVWPDLLARQLESPVRWTESVLEMRSSGIDVFVECGSGEVLVGLLKRIDKEATGMAIQDAESLRRTGEALRPVGAGS